MLRYFSFFVLPYHLFIFIILKLIFIGVQGFPGGSAVKNLPANAGDTSLIPESGRSPGEGSGNRILQLLAWKTPWTEAPGRLQSMGFKELDRTQLLNDNDNSCFTMFCSFLLYSKVNQPRGYIYPLFLAWPSHLGPHRAFKQSSPHYTVGSHQLSIRYFSYRAFSFGVRLTSPSEPMSISQCSG